jgi:tetratricopeptide (TPR) repeat protein
MRGTERYFLILFLIFILSLSIIKIEDTDTWMHLSLGRTIWENRGIPEKEVFVYTAKDLPFLYTSWLFGLTYFLTWKVFGIPGVILLMALTVCAFYTVLFLDALRPHRNIPLVLLVMALSVLIMRERFVERPDTFSFLFISLLIFSIHAYIHEGKRYIYLMPLVALLWANIHSSIVLMPVIFCSFIAGGFIEYLLSKKGYQFLFTPEPQKIRNIFFVFLLSFFLSLLNPNSYTQYTFGSDIMGPFTWYKHEIVELQEPTWRTYKAPFILTGLLLISFLLPLLRALLKKDKVFNLSISHLFLLLPFAYMAFIALRFTFPYCIVATPVIARNLSPFFPSWRPSFKLRAIATALLFLFWLGIFLGPLDTTIPKKEFGIGIDYRLIPEGALKYMDRNNINGRVFNLFQLGGYIVWRDYPKRSVSIDPRGYVSAELLEKMSLAHGRPETMEELWQKYGFNSYLWSYRILNPEAGYDVGSIHSEAGIDAAMRSEKWALVYWDDQFLLYLRRSPEFRGIIERDEYKYVRPANGVGHIKKLVLYRGLGEEVIEELKRNISQTGSDNARLLLASAYIYLGRYSEAFSVLKEVDEDNILIDRTLLWDSLALCLSNLGRIDDAIYYYKKSYSEFPRPSIPYRIGLLFLSLGNEDKARHFLESSLKEDPSFLSPYPILADLYRKKGREKEALELLSRYSLLLKRNEAEDHFKEGLKHYMRKDLQKALSSFNESLRINPYNASSLINIGYIYLDMGDVERALEYFQRVVELSPERSEPYYGMGLAYKYLGQKKRARDAFQRYIELEPKGYFTRLAKSEIDRLGE